MPSGKPIGSATTGSDASSVGLCISLFGTFAVWLGQCEIPPAAFPRRKALHLLKLIALEPDHQLHRDQVLDLLWPNLVPRSAMAQLYKAIHHVRQAFATATPPCPPDRLLELHEEVIRLNAPAGVHTDVFTFGQLAQEALRSHDLRLLQQAVSCYRGDLLLTDRYEEWTQPHREALQERLVDLLVALGTRWQETSLLAEAADAYRQVLARDETREIAHRGLMTVYALQGSRTRALRQYQQCANLLLQELGVEPAQETNILYEKILNGEVQSNRSLYANTSVELLLPPPLVGRHRERDEVGALLKRLDSGHGGVLALEGQVGIGKSRLAQEILREGGQRWHVLSGSAHEQERHLPYMPIIEALRKAIRIDPTDAHLIPAELAVAIPELPATALPVATADLVAAQSALFAGVLRFLMARAERIPIVLILDDLHAADPGTWKLFHYLARQTAEMPLLLVAIWRSDELDTVPILDNIISSLERQSLLHRLPLSALSQEEHHLLLAQTLEGAAVDLELADTLFRLSAGNPLFIKEMSRQLIAEEKIVLVNNMWCFTSDAKAVDMPSLLPVPPSLQTLVNSRLTSLSPAALRLLQFAAVVGWDIPVPLLEAWSRLGEQRVPDPALLDVLDAAVDAGLLQEQGLSYRFVHPLFRQVIYRQTSSVRRRALHGQVAVGLEDCFQDNMADLPVEAVAFHYQQAGNVELAAHYLIMTGDRAESVFDHDSALCRYEEALSLFPEPRASRTGRLLATIYERIGDVQRAIGNVARSLEAYRQALDVLAQNKTMADRVDQHMLHRKITHAAVLTPDMDAAIEHLQQAWALLETENPLEKARMLITQALFDWHANQLEAAIEHAAQALALAERERAPVEMSQACEMLAMAYLPLGYWEVAFQYELRRQTPDWSPEIVLAIDAHLCLYQFRLQGAEPYRQVKQFIQSVAQKASTVGNLRCLAVCHFVLGSLALSQGEPETADEHLTEALKLHQQIGAPAAAAYTLARLTNLLTTIGESQSGWECVQMGLEVAGQAAIRDHCTMMIHTAGIWNRLAVSDLPAAAELVGIARQHEIEAAPCAVCSVDRHAAIAAYLVAAGDLDTAGHYTDSALQLAQFAQNRLGQARALHVQGQIHAARGEMVQAKTVLSTAVNIFQELDNRYELAQTLLVWGNLPTHGEESPQEQQARRQAAQELLVPYQAMAILRRDQ